MEHLTLHVNEELDDEQIDYEATDIVDILRNNRQDIRDRLTALKSDIEANIALEVFTGSLITKKYI